MPRFRRFVCLTASFVLAGVAVGQYPGATPPPEKLKAGFDAISIGKAKKILEFLAGPECQGRGTGQPGFQKAADFVARRFHDAGLKPMGDKGTYFQHQTFYGTSCTDIHVTVDGKEIFRRGFVISPVNHDVNVISPVMVVRATSKTAKLPDDKAAKLEGKIVLEFVPAGSSSLKSQVAAAETLATIVVVDGEPIVAPMVRARPGLAGQSYVSCRVSHRTAESLGREVATFARKKWELDHPAEMLQLATPLHITAKAVSEPVSVPNVVGLLEGSDPKLKADVVGVGGHLDHLGVNSAGVVYPGADDDGSGSTAVMLIADAMAHNPEKPKRSILFMTFFGEEMGLLGSSFLSNHPPVPLDKMVSELQMDMVARDSYGVQNNDANRVDKLEENIDTMRLVGSKRISTELDQIILAQNEHVKFRFRYDAEDVYTRSDHYNFARHGVPIAFLFDGFTPDYHQPTDTVDKIDFVKLTNAAKLYYLTAFAVADMDHAPKHDVK